MIKNIVLFALWFIVWCGLSWPVKHEGVILGIIVSIFVTYMTVDLSNNIDERQGAKKYSIISNIKRAGWLICYAVIFLWECVKANVDVASRVLHPDMPIRPGTVKVKVSLKSDIGLTFLANSITLTPGTTSVDVDKENGWLYVHWIYVRDGYGKGTVKLPVVEKFENILKRIFE